MKIANSDAESVVPQMVAVYRHDAHKFRGQSHANAPEEWNGISVNEDVPYGADGDAAAMSRPSGKPHQTLAGHDTHYRRSIADGTVSYDEERFSLRRIESEVLKLLEERPVATMHKRWLHSRVAAGFNESVYYPYTSLKFHTVLVAALVWWYRDGYEYDDLGLWLLDDAETVTPPLVFRTERFQLAIAPHEKGKSAKLSSYPMQNFASVWMRMPRHPWNHNPLNEHDRWVDAQLRRIKSWSTALQYLDVQFGGK